MQGCEDQEMEDVFEDMEMADNQGSTTQPEVMPQTVLRQEEVSFVEESHTVSETCTHDGSSRKLQLPSREDTLTMNTTATNSGSGIKDNKKRWSKEEDDQLMQAVNMFGNKKWKEIAFCVPGRTNVQCRYRWHNVLNPELVKGHWTKEEDDMLTEAVENLGSKNWKQIAKCVAGRTNVQCLDRWYKALNPELIKGLKGPWTQEEDEKLTFGVQLYGRDWKKIADCVEGRTNKQCLDRWSFVIDPSLVKNNASWSQDQDALLI